MKKAILIAAVLISSLFAISTLTIKPSNGLEVNRNLFGLHSFFADNNCQRVTDTVRNDTTYYNINPADSTEMHKIGLSFFRASYFAPYEYLNLFDNWYSLAGPTDSTKRRQVEETIGSFDNRIKYSTAARYRLPHLVAAARADGAKVMFAWLQLQTSMVKDLSDTTDKTGYFPDEVTNPLDTTATLYIAPSGDSSYYYPYEISTFVKPFIQFLHYCYADTGDTNSDAKKWAKLRTYDMDTSATLEDVINQIQFGNDGIITLYDVVDRNLGSGIMADTLALESWAVRNYPFRYTADSDSDGTNDCNPYFGHLPLSTPHVINPWEQMPDNPDIDSMDNYKEYFYRQNRLVNFYFRIFKMCKDSLEFYYPEKNIQLNPDIHYMAGNNGSQLKINVEHNETNRRIYNGLTLPIKKRSMDVDYLFAKRLFNLADTAVATNSNVPYVSAIVGNNGHMYLSKTDGTFKVNQKSIDSLLGGDTLNFMCADSATKVFDHVDTSSGDSIYKTVYVHNPGTSSAMLDSITRNSMTYYNLCTKTQKTPTDTMPYSRSMKFMYNWFYNNADGDSNVTNRVPFILSEWGVWPTNDFGHGNRCGIPFANNLLNALNLSDAYRVLMRRNDEPDSFPEVSAAALHGYSPFPYQTNYTYSLTEKCRYMEYDPRKLNDTTYTSCITCNSRSSRKLEHTNPAYSPCDSSVKYTAWFDFKKHSPRLVNYIIKEGAATQHFAQWYPLFLYANHFGKYLLDFDKSGVQTLISGTGTTLSGYDKVTFNPSIGSDGVVRTIICNKNLANPETVMVVIDDEIASTITDAKIYCVTGNESAWNTLMDSVWLWNGRTTPGWAPSYFMHNNYIQYFMDMSYHELIHIDSTTTDGAGEMLYAINGGTTYHWNDAGFTTALQASGVLYAVLPKHSMAAVEIFPVVDTFDIVLHTGPNLISMPVYSDLKLKDIFGVDSDTVYSRKLYATDSLGDSAYTYFYHVMRYDPDRVLPLSHPESYRILNKQWKYVSYLDSVPVPGAGYWVYSDTCDTVHVIGVPIRKYNTPVDTAFYMIGATSEEQRITKPGGFNYEPDSIIPSELFYTYSGEKTNYAWQNNCIKPGEGYFIPISYKGMLSFPDTALACASFVYSKPIESAVRHFRMLESPPGTIDTMTFKCAIVSDTLTVTRAYNGSAVENALVIAWRDANYVTGYTGSTGKFYSNSLIKKDSLSSIFIFKPGYREMLVHPYATIKTDDTLQGDVTIFGDVRVPTGRTLTIKPDTRIFMPPSADALNCGFVTRTEIVADGGHVQIDGTKAQPVTFLPITGGSGNFQVEGVTLKNNGTANIRYTTFNYGYIPIYTNFNAGKVKASHVRVLHQGLVVSDYRNQTDTTKVNFQIDSSFIDNRMMFQYSGDSCYAVACSLNGSYYEGATVEGSKFGGKPKYIDCYIKGESSRCARIQYGGKINFINCAFDGVNLDQGVPVIIEMSADSVYLDTCYIDGVYSDKSFYGSSSSGFVKSRYSIFENYNTSFYVYNPTDLGLVSNPGHNCFLDNYGMAVFNYKTTVNAQWNYFDTLLFGGGTVYHDSLDIYCHPDSTLSKLRDNNNPPPQVKPPVPSQFAIGPAIPNPFNSTIEIHYTIPEDSDINISVYDVSGRLVQTLFNGIEKSGSHRIVWDGRDFAGAQMPSGVYIARLTSPRSGDNKIIILIR